MKTINTNLDTTWKQDMEKYRKSVSNKEHNHYSTGVRIMRTAILTHGRSEPKPMEDDLAQSEYNALPSALWVIGSILLCGLMLISSCKVAHAEIKDEDAVLAIIGEDSASFPRMLSVACAIRNRGSLDGVYGLESYRVKYHKYTEKTKKQAVDAWVVSETQGNCDFLNNATEWRSKLIKDEDKQINKKNFTCVFENAGHKFYKKIGV